MFLRSSNAMWAEMGSEKFARCFNRRWQSIHSQKGLRTAELFTMLSRDRNFAALLLNGGAGVQLALQINLKLFSSLIRNVSVPTSFEAFIFMPSLSVMSSFSERKDCRIEKGHTIRALTGLCV